MNQTTVDNILSSIIDFGWEEMRGSDQDDFVIPGVVICIKRVYNYQEQSLFLMQDDKMMHFLHVFYKGRKIATINTATMYLVRDSFKDLRDSNISVENFFKDFVTKS